MCRFHLFGVGPGLGFYNVHPSREIKRLRNLDTSRRIFSIESIRTAERAIGVHDRWF